MTTVINNPGSAEGADASIGIIAAVALFLVVAGLFLAGLFLVYGIPAIRGGATTPKSDTAHVNITLPAGDQETSAAPVPKSQSY